VVCSSVYVIRSCDELTEAHNVHIEEHRTALHMDLAAEVDSIVRYLRNKHIVYLLALGTHCIVVYVSLCPFSDM